MATKIVSENLGSQTVVTTAETVVMTTPAYVYDEANPFVGGEHQGAGQGVTVSGIINVTPVGTGATSATVRVRQGSISGPIVGGAAGTITQNVVAGNSLEITYEAVDTSRFCAQSGGGVYVVTIQFTGATGNSTIQPVTVDVEGA